MSEENKENSDVRVEDRRRLIGAHLHQQPPAPSEASGRTDISEELDALVLRCLAKKPEDRFTTATALSVQLQALLLGLAGGTAEDTVEMHPRQRLRRAQRCYRTHEYAALAPTMLSHELAPPPPEAAQKPESGAGRDDLDDGPTVAEWPAGAASEQGPARSRALEELVYALRDRGLGSVELSRVLSLKLEAESRILEVESDLALLDANIFETEMKARETEARLRQALNQVEHERSTLQAQAPAMEPSDETLPYGSSLSALDPADQLRQLGLRASELAERMRAVSSSMEQNLESLQARRATFEQQIDALGEKVQDHETRLAELLAEVKASAVDQLDQETAQLFTVASV